MPDALSNNHLAKNCRKQLQAIATLQNNIRSFFAQRDVLEVQTSLLRMFTVTDPHIQSFYVPKINKFLQTSPEYAMKQLLANGSGAIFQICKAFRDEEQGRYHKEEFTMLEWYRPGFDHHQLMREVAELLKFCFGNLNIIYLSYAQLINRYLGLEFKHLTLEIVKQKCVEYKIDLESSIDLLVDDLLSLLITHVVEPQLINLGAVFVYDFPPSQAALAKLSIDKSVAHRFEVYIKGIECGNGFWELTCAHEQRKRFSQDNIERERRGLLQLQPDENLLSALIQGLPNCSGVAIGLDRILMLLLGTREI